MKRPNPSRSSSLFTKAVALALSLSLAGCFGARVSTGLKPSGIVESDTGVSWLWGITTTHTKATECKDGLSSVETWWPWWSAALVAPLTLGIIVPIEKEYACAAKDA